MLIDAIFLVTHIIKDVTSRIHNREVWAVDVIYLEYAFTYMFKGTTSVRFIWALYKGFLMYSCMVISVSKQCLSMFVLNILATSDALIILC